MVLPTSLPITSLYCNHYATCLSVACIAMNARCNWPSGMVPVRLACDQCGSIPRDTMLNKSKIVFSTISCISKWSGTTFQTNTRFVNRLHTIKTHKRCNEPNITALPPVKLEICLRKHTSNSWFSFFSAFLRSQESPKKKTLKVTLWMNYMRFAHFFLTIIWKNTGVD